MKINNNFLEMSINVSIMNEGEKKYKRFCDNIQATVFYLHQSPDSFSEVIKKKGGKRPDFYHITPVGDFYVDVKSSKLNLYPKYTFSLDDYNKLKISQKILKKPILIAYPIDPWSGEDWGFISLTHMLCLKKEQKDLIQRGYRFIGINYSNLKKYEEILQLLI